MNWGRDRMCIWCLLYLSLVVVPSFTEARIHHYRWNVRYEYKSPDWYEKLAITINGQFLGPTIEAQVGVTIHVQLTNQMETENVVLHWHIIRECKKPWSDGTGGVTQCPIIPEETFVYNL